MDFPRFAAMRTLRTPSTCTGSDPQSHGVPWPRTTRRIVNRLYTFQAKPLDLHFVAMMDRAMAEAWRWDEPELDEITLSRIESSRRRAEEGD